MSKRSKQLKRGLGLAPQAGPAEPSIEEASKALHRALDARWEKALRAPGFIAHLLRNLERVRQGDLRGRPDAEISVLEDAAAYLGLLANAGVAKRAGEKVPDQLSVEEKDAIEMARIVTLAASHRLAA